MSDFKKLMVAAFALVGLAIVTIMGIAVLNGFVETGLVPNATAQLFITGLGVFATFSGILALAIMGKAVMGLFKSSGN